MEIKHNLTIKEQIANILLDQINSGHYTAGQRLPSESELSEELNVSRASVRSALSALEAAGLISRKQGDGTYVNTNRPGLTSMASAVWEFKHLIESQGRKCSLRGLEAIVRKPDPNERVIFEMEEGQDVASLKRIIFADQVPIIYSLNVFPLSNLKDHVSVRQLDLTKGLDDFIASYIDHKITGVNMEISAQIGVQEVADEFNIRDSEPVLKLVEIFHGQKNQPIIYTNNYIWDFSLPIHVLKPW